MAWPLDEESSAATAAKVLDQVRQVFCKIQQFSEYGDFSVSFSAGIDKQNFPSAVACGMVPVTTCSDLLKPGGYGRLPAYMDALAAAMKAIEAEYLKSSRLNSGEDQTFCRRAAKVGHQPFVDLGLVCGHIGSTVFGPHNTGKK